MAKELNKEQRYYLSMLKAHMGDVGGLLAAYRKPSKAKIYAFHAIAMECNERRGYGLCVLWATCKLFAAGYFYPDAITGEIRAHIVLPTRTLDFAVVE